MKKINLSKDWYFSKSPKYEEKELIDLPHDYVIGSKRSPEAPSASTTGYYYGGVGHYLKYIKTEAPHVFLDIDGAYMCAELTVNRNFIEMHPHGYTPFLVDVSEWIWQDTTNKIEIKTNSVEMSSRWYAGGGIYRDVFLWEGGEIRIEPRDVFFYTESVEENKAVVKTEVIVTADRDAEVSVRLKLCGYTEEKQLSVHAGKNKVEYTMEIANPQLWDTKQPNLHQLEVVVMEGDSIADEASLMVGIRQFTYSVDGGLRLNGKEIKLKGGCIHHDHGVVGTAALPAAEERKILKLKSVGFNAVRIAHNPPSLALLQVCDREGMIVIDEFFDIWAMGKTACDYHYWFPDWWERDLQAAILRDRNHASVFAWSIGNEVGERNGKSRGVEWAGKLYREVKKYDHTRPVTGGINGGMIGPRLDTDPEDYWEKTCEGFTDIGGGGIGDSFAPRTAKFFEQFDIAGYNYLAFRFENDHELFPDRMFIETESQALKFYEIWDMIQRCSYAFGDFCWTAYDNIGEAGCGKYIWEKEGTLDWLIAGEYPWRTCFQGDFDLAGFRRPQSYFREAVWNRLAEPRAFTTHPIHNGEGFSGTGWHFYDVCHTWNYPEEYIGEPITTEVYSTADFVEFELNGRLVAKVTPEKAIARITIPYERGVLKTYGIINGERVAESVLETVGEARSVKVVPEKNSLLADNRDLCYVDIFILDEAGRCIETDGREITCRAEGCELMGVFGGNPQNEDEYTSNKCHVYWGKAVAVLRCKEAGEVKLIVEADGLVSGECTVVAGEKDC